MREWPKKAQAGFAAPRDRGQFGPGREGMVPLPVPPNSLADRRTMGGSTEAGGL